MPDITKTRAELVLAALEELNADGGSGQSPSAEDSEFVDNKVDSLFASLNERNIIYVGDANAIPVEHFDYLSWLLANQCASKYGKPKDPGQILFAETELKRMSSGKPTYETLQVDYF